MQSTSSRLASLLGLVAALLAWSAVAVRYARQGTVDWGIVAAGAFCAALAFSARARGRAGQPPGTEPTVGPP